MKTFYFKDAIQPEQLKALKTLGYTCLIVERIPFNRIEQIEAGGLIRMGIAIGGWASCVVDGIEFKMSFDIEGFGNNGTAYLQPDVRFIEAALEGLKPTPRKQFVEWLTTVLAKLQEQQAEYRKHANNLNFSINTIKDAIG